MALITKILLPLLLIGIVHGNVVIQIEQKVDSCCGGCCPCDSCDTTTEAQTQPTIVTTAQPPTADKTTQPITTVSVTYPPCIRDVIEVGGKEFLFFLIYKNFSQAQDYCITNGWTLATPDEDFEEFNDEMPSGEEYWVDVKPDLSIIDPNFPLTWYWQTEPKEIVTIHQWQVGSFNQTTKNDGDFCASILQDDHLLAFPCTNEAYFACERIVTTYNEVLVCPEENDDDQVAKKIGSDGRIKEEKQFNFRNNTKINY